MPIIQWRGDEYVDAVNVASSKGLQKAGVFLVGEIKRSFPGSGIDNATRAQREVNRSEAGEIPHVQTGSLKRSITRERVRDQERVGTNLKYGRYLELGTLFMDARPFLRPALFKHRREILKIIKRAIR